MNRSSGILMPIFSLPSPYGIGTLGKAAYDFADFLAEAGQHYWQMLPLGPTSYGDSPYQSFSTFAGNPYFIDPDLLDKYNRGSRGVWVAQTPALSVIDWGRYAFDSDAELVKFFAMHGHSLVACGDIDRYAEAEEESLKLPEYPQDGYIVDKGDYIIVHF